MGKLSEAKINILKILPLLIFLLIWEFLISPIGKNTFLFSKPSLVFIVLIENIKKMQLVYDFLVTGYEALMGFIIGNIVGVVIGFSLWYSELIAKISKPYIIAIGAIPIFAIAPMTIMWFGTGIFAKIMMAALSTFTIALSQSYLGSQNVDVNQINLLKTFGASKFLIFRKLIIPSSLIWVFSSLKLNIAFALLGAFIGEFISSERGLGYRILKSSSLYDTSLLLAALLCLVLLAFFLNSVVGIFERKFVRYIKKS